LALNTATIKQYAFQSAKPQLNDFETIKSRLGKLIREKAYLEGEFTLSSGKKSDHYFDCKKITLDPEGLTLLSRLLVFKLQEKNVHNVGGLTIGADPIVAGIVTCSFLMNYPVSGFIVRKEPKKHGTHLWIEGPVEKGMRVAIVDDVVTSGGSIIKAINTCRDEGLDPVMAFALVDREEGGREQIEKDCQLPFEALYEYSELSLKS